MARNFVIFYTAREGSTALVEALSRRPNIRVPLLEELDRYRMRRSMPGADVCDVMERVFRTGRLEGGDSAGRRHLPRPDDGTPVEGVGFKWRPHGDWSRIAETFRRNGVATVIIHRPILDVVASLHFSRRMRRTHGAGAPGAGHFQFRYARMSQADQARISEVLDTARVDLSLADFHLLLLKRTMHTARKVGLLWMLARRGLPTGVVEYELIVRSPDAAAARVLAMAGLSAPPPVETDAPRLRKASRVPAARKTRGYWLVWCSPATWVCVAADRALIAFARLLGQGAEKPVTQDVSA